MNKKLSLGENFLKEGWEELKTDSVKNNMKEG